jgi:penicillin-binding protein 1C
MPKKKFFSFFVTIILIVIICFLTGSYFLQKQLMDIYSGQNSLIIKDRTGQIIAIEQNKKGYWAEYLDETPNEFKNVLIDKEDKYFYYHFGINPYSSFQAMLGYFNLAPKRASSTVTQQLVKILLEKEFERNPKNKIIEAFYTLSLEIFQSKKTILKMYVNSIYFGNQSQGLSSASCLYFNVSPDMLTNSQTLQLLAGISAPSQNNPSKKTNKEIALLLSKKLELDDIEFIDSDTVKQNIRKYSHSSNSYFEIKNLIDKNDISKIHQLTLDKSLNEKIREIVQLNTENLKPKNVTNSSVVVIKIPENEILALIGSPHPESFEHGYQINMLEKPRPIGSTIKPFIYLKGFEKGLRPYTLVDDREYKYITAIGLPLYPKNFDYKYRGEVTLHYSLSNSLNVPSVKILEYVELENFYNFLEKDLEFEPIQDLNNYQLGIALGALEMNLFELAKYFTIFPNNGILQNSKIYQDKSYPKKQIAEEKYIQLINKILNDRKTGIEQFGLKSDLNLFQKNYALKTGTSRNFKDSWIIGYTPDFLVGVWMGNADNSPMNQISGQIGAGRVWSETMDLLLNSEYNKKTPFNFIQLKEFYKENNIEYGLHEDDYEKSRNILKQQDSDLILTPHQEDIFLFENNTKINLEAKENVKWLINDKFFNKAKICVFSPQSPGTYKITALSDSASQTITIFLFE